MLIDEPNLYLLESKFYRYDNEFNSFNDITPEIYNYIKEETEKFKNRTFCNQKLKDYISTLKFLTNFLGRYSKTKSTTILNNFDEVVLFFILCCDEKLYALDYYIHLNKKVSNEKKQSLIRNKIGFYNNKIIRYERSYYTNIEKNLFRDVQLNCLSYLNLLTLSKTNFDEVDNEKLDNIKLIVNEWLKIQDKKYLVNSCIYAIIYQSKLLGLNNLDEKLVFFINAIDPNLKALKFFEEESTVKNLQEKLINELGFYLPNFIKLETIYHNKFLPNLQISEWPCTKVYKKGD